MKVLPDINVVDAMYDAFTEYSAGNAIVPPVGELLFSDPPGDAHIKYGYLKNDRWFVIKVATGFYNNPAMGLPGNSGLMLIFDACTGMPHTVFLDEGHLTNVRTAAAGAFAAKLLAPKNVTRIGIIGSGMQARMQLEMLQNITPCRDVSIFARDASKAGKYASEMQGKGYRVSVTSSPRAVAAECNLIVTTTAAHEPFLFAKDIKPGTHITAMGSDTVEKNEIGADVLAKADLVVADSIAQCCERGEIHHALAAGAITQSNIIELGTLASAQSCRPSEEAITIADLTGVAVQDIEICKAVMTRLTPEN